MIHEIFFGFFVWFNCFHLSKCIQVDRVIWTPLKVDPNHDDVPVALNLTPLQGTSLAHVAATCHKSPKCKLFCLINGEYQQSEADIHPETCTIVSKPELLDCWTSGL